MDSRSIDASKNYRLRSTISTALRNSIFLGQEMGGGKGHRILLVPLNTLCSPKISTAFACNPSP